MARNSRTSTNRSCYRKPRLGIFTKKILMQPRVVRMLHSMLASRVLLHIRAVAGDNAVLSDGLVDLNKLT